MLAGLPHFRRCGPRRVACPGGIWYHSVTPGVFARPVDEQLVGGRDVEDFASANHPMTGTDRPEDLSAMMRPITCFAAFLCTFAPAATSIAAEGPAGEVPELRVLGHYVGDWGDAMTIKPSGDFSKGVKVEGTAKGEWTLGGRFLRQTWEMKAGDGLPAMTGTTLMTFDPGRKAYRNWAFYSSGAAVESVGTWDEAAKTMTWTHRDPESGRTSVTKAAFAEEGVENWSIVEKDRAGAVVGEFIGKNTRRKP